MEVQYSDAQVCIYAVGILYIEFILHIYKLIHAASRFWLREFIGVNMLAVILEKGGCAKKRRFCANDWEWLFLPNYMVMWVSGMLVSCGPILCGHYLKVTIFSRY